MLVFGIRSASEIETEYTVIVSNQAGGPNEWTCECPGFYYRDTCRHIDIAKDALIAGITSMRYESSPEEE
jgi:hypothetical protein